MTDVQAILRAFDLYRSDSTAETAAAFAILAVAVGPLVYSLLRR